MGLHDPSLVFLLFFRYIVSSHFYDCSLLCWVFESPLFYDCSLLCSLDSKTGRSFSRVGKKWGLRESNVQILRDEKERGCGRR